MAFLVQYREAKLCPYCLVVRQSLISSVLPKKSLLLLLTALTFQSVVQADNTGSPYFKGGKLDAFYDRQDSGVFQVNSILWSPVVKGGMALSARKPAARLSITMGASQDLY